MLYYVSGSVSGGAYCRCFTSEAERDHFYNMVSGYWHNLRTWENKIS